MSDPLKLDIGCGAKREDGWTGLDIRPEAQPDIVRDVCRGLPFGDGVVEEVRCHQVLEHLPTPDDVLFVLREMHRVCRPGATITISVPRYDSMGAWGDITHVRAFHEREFHTIASHFCEGLFRIRRLRVDAWREESDPLDEPRKNVVCIFEVLK